jgi:transcription initiation factor TFIIIB Brf1 subunit/transcription initiation factor TFIIB
MMYSQSRFCALMQLPPSVQDLAIHVAIEMVRKNFSTRRNPTSISAACLCDTSPFPNNFRLAN